MINWLEDIGYGTVTGRFGGITGDGPDADRLPDTHSKRSGTVTFRPSVPFVRYTGSGGSIMLSLDPFEAVIDNEGYLCTKMPSGLPGERGVVLPASDSSVISPRNFTYSVTINIEGTNFANFSIRVNAGEELDLSSAIPVQSSSGNVVIVDNSSADRAENAAGRAEQARNDVESFRDDFDSFTQEVEDALQGLGDSSVSDLINDRASQVSTTLRSNFASKKSVAITPYDFGATEVGSTIDNTQPLQDMFAYAETHGASDIYLPPGDWVTYGGGFSLDHGTTLRGAGPRNSYLINKSNSPLFTWSGLKYGITMENFGVQGGGDQHIIHLTYGGIVQSSFRDLFWYVTDGEARIIFQESEDFINNVFDNCVFERGKNNVNPAIELSSEGATNGNQMRQIWMHSHDNTHSPFMKLGAATGETYLTDWIFSGIVGEQNAGGLIHAYGLNNAVFSVCCDYDVWNEDGYVDDLFKVVPNAQGLPSESVTFTNCMRVGSFMSEGTYEFNVQGSHNVIIDACTPVPRAEPKILGDPIMRGNFGGNPNVVQLVEVETPEGNYSNDPGTLLYDPLEKAIFLGDGTQWHKIRAVSGSGGIEDIILESTENPEGNYTNVPGTLLYDSIRRTLYLGDGEEWLTLTRELTDSEYADPIELISVEVPEGNYTNNPGTLLYDSLRKTLYLGDGEHWHTIMRESAPGEYPDPIQLIAIENPVGNYNNVEGALLYDDLRKTIHVGTGVGDEWVTLSREPLPGEDVRPLQTDLRPTSEEQHTHQEGRMIYSSDRNMLLISDGTVWRDVLGNVVTPIPE